MEFLQKYGKKILIGAGVTAAVATGYPLSLNNNYVDYIWF